MDIKELSKLSASELNEKLVELKDDYRKAKKTHAAGDLANPQVLSRTRKAIARVKTLIAANNSRKDGDNA